MFGFEPSKRRVFGTNFLKTVIFKIDYDRIHDFEQKAKRIWTIFESDYPRQRNIKGDEIKLSLGTEGTPQIEKTSNNIELIELKTVDGQRIVHISRTSLTVTINGKAYKSEESLLSDFDKIAEFSEYCDVRKINRLATRKINIFEFTQQGDAPDILRHLINNRLLGEANVFPESASIIHSIQSIRLKKGDFNLILQFGLTIPQPERENIGNVVVDIDLFQGSELNVNQMKEVTQKINTEIFNIFNWVISDSTRDLLDGRK
jgi:uncharacterized protein (TIGR04255 family)